METRQTKEERSRYYARFFTSFFFILSIVLLILGIELYRRTVINPGILTIVAALGAVVGFLLLWRKSLLIMNRIGAALNCCFTGGAVFYYFFLFLNYHFADSRLLTAELAIIESGTLTKGRKSSCGRPFFVINFNGREKELVFKCDLERHLEDYKSVHVAYQEGLFGNEYIVEKNPILN